MAQGHLDPIDALMRDEAGGVPTLALAGVEIQTLVSGPFSNMRVVSTVYLNCVQTSERVALAQERAIEQSMEGLRNGWEILQGRIAKGHFPGCAQ